MKNWLTLRIVSSKTKFQTKRPEQRSINILSLRTSRGLIKTPRVNPLIWSQLPAQVRTQDSKHQKSQKSLVAAVVAITKATDIVLKQNHSDNKELLTTLTDGIALAMNCLHDMNSTRRQSMKKDLHRDYAALCNATTVQSWSEFLFGDLSKLTKDISDANKLTKKVRPASHSFTQ